MSLVAPKDSHVTPYYAPHDIVNLYSAELDQQTTNIHKKTVPFIHPIELTNQTGEVIRVRALFDDGAMTGAMCTTVFQTIKHRLKGWRTTTQTLRMANGTIIKAEAEWEGTMRIKGVETRGSFLVFNSGGGWAFLLGKPLLAAFRAIHEYGTDTIKIGDNKNQVMLTNHFFDSRHLQVAGKQGHTLDIKQIAQVEKENTGSINMETQVLKEQAMEASTTARLAVYKIDTEQADAKVFTRRTDPFNRQRIEYITRSIKIGDDVTPEERTEVEALIAEYADVFACSLSEVLLIPGARVNLNVPVDAQFNTNI